MANYISSGAFPGIIDRLHFVQGYASTVLTLLATTSYIVFSSPSLPLNFAVLILPVTCKGIPLVMFLKSGIPLPPHATTLNQVLSQSFDNTCYANNTIIKSE